MKAMPMSSGGRRLNLRFVLVAVLIASLALWAVAVAALADLFG